MGQHLRMRSGVVLAIICLMGGAAACSSTAPPSNHARPVTVALSSDLEGHDGHGRPIVQIEVGGGQPIWVTLDTGSVGLRVRASAVSGHEVSISKRPDAIAFQDGTELTGVVATAPIRIGGLLSSAVSLELVKHITCTPKRPLCPRLRSSPGNGAPKVAGVLGIGLYGARDGYPSNPLLSLPMPYDASWSIMMGQGGVPQGSGGRLVLGAVPPGHPIETLHLSLDSAITTTPSDWNDSPLLCWRLDSSKRCGATHFDTGSSNVVVTGTSTTPREQLPAGTTLEVDQSGSTTAIWRLRSGVFADDNRIVRIPGANPTINLGVPFFYTHTVSFDETYGLIAVR